MEVTLELDSNETAMKLKCSVYSLDEGVFYRRKVSFKMFLKFMLIDDRSATPTNVLLRRAC